MLRTLVVVLNLLLLAWQGAVAAPWELPPGVKTLTVNSYPMAYLESGAGEAVVLVHGLGPDYWVWRTQTASPPLGFRLIAVSLRHSYPLNKTVDSDTSQALRRALARAHPRGR